MSLPKSRTYPIWTPLPSSFLRHAFSAGWCFFRRLAYNNLGPEGAKALAPGLAATASLTHCDVRENKIAGEGASQLSAAVLANTKIEVFNEIPIKEMRADSLTTLDLSNKKIGVEGGMVVAGLVPVTASLTKIS